MSFLRWAGSKKQLSELLANCWYAAQGAGGSGRYIEAFCGSASLFFRLKPEQALLIDINRPLIECYQVVRSAPIKLFEKLESYEQSKSYYYALRGVDTSILTKTERAARFIFLNRYCFNGLYRTNQKGVFNVPYGASRNGTLPNLPQLRESAVTLRAAELYCGDFEIIFKKIRPGDFVYLDPPYAKRNHSLDFQYGPDVFGVQDLQRIVALLRHIDSVGAFFVFSYAKCDDIQPLIDEWGAHEVDVKRTIAANSAKRMKSTEVLIANF
jgi:DNA adenine methylase